VAGRPSLATLSAIRGEAQRRNAAMQQSPARQEVQLEATRSKSGKWMPGPVFKFSSLAAHR
jgi:hypothetical protein